MKKITLLFLALIAGFTMHSQSTSFESSEGFSLANINGQNGWTALGTATTSIITDSQASDGTFSLELTPTNSQAVTGAFSPTFVSSQDVIVTVDMYLESLAVGELSDTDFVTQSPSQSMLTSRVNFSFDGNINILDDPGSGPAFIPSGAMVIRDAWFELKIEHVFSNGEILFYIDDVLIYTGAVWAGTNVEQIIPLFDDFESSAIFDNIVYEDGLILGVEHNELDENSISLFPNPTQGDLNINFSKDFGNTNIDIVNVTGQKVLNTSFEGTGSKKINTNTLANGVYFAQIATGSGKTTIKFIKN